MSTWDQTVTENQASFSSPDKDASIRGLFDVGVFDTAIFDDTGSPLAYTSPSENSASYSSPTKN